MVGHLHHRRLQHDMLRALSALCLLAALLVLVSATAALADDPPAGNGANCDNFRCGVGAADPGSPGSPGVGAPPSAPPNSGSASDAASGSQHTGGEGDTGAGANSAPACTEQPLSPQPAANSPWWDGQTSAEGQVVSWVCADGSTPVVVVPHFTASAAAAPPPPAQTVPEQIEHLARLRDQGALTEEEFQAKKSELLGRM